MATTNSANQEYANNADGFRLGGGTTKRTLTISGSDITVTGEADGFNMVGGTTNPRTLDVSGANITIVGAGTGTYTYPASTDTLMGLAETLASQAEQETGTSTTRYVSPGRQHYHLSAIKCFGFTTGAGTPALHANSYNMTSITDTATGRLTVTIATDFSSANWCGTVSPTCATNANRMTSLVSKAAGSVILESSSAATTLADPGTGWDWQFTGDQ